MEADRLASFFGGQEGVDEVIPISALNGHNVKGVEDWAVAQLPEGPSLYPKASACSMQAPLPETHIRQLALTGKVMHGDDVASCQCIGCAERASGAVLCGGDHPREDLPAVP